MNQSINFSEYGVAHPKRLDVGNYACALLCAVHLVFKKFSWIDVEKIINHIKINTIIPQNLFLKVLRISKGLFQKSLGRGAGQSLAKL